ncbi:MAG: hypothetical protein JNL80_16510 [Phycisphaerae bacterium]|nr:hypothetical protein [Phycisphaerae bacterium]
MSRLIVLGSRWIGVLGPSVVVAVALAEPRQVPATQAVPAVRIVPASGTSGAGTTSRVVQGVPVSPTVPASAVGQPVVPAGVVGGQGLPAQGVPVADLPVPGLSAEEISDIRREYANANEEERAALRAYLTDSLASLLSGPLAAQGIDLDVILGLKVAGAAPAVVPFPEAIKQLDFTRTPQAVLSARSQLGFGAVKRPEDKNPAGLAKWFHIQFLAGEWETVRTFITELPEAEGKAVYTHLLQNANKRPQGDPNQKVDPPFLPEEVIALAEIAPGSLEDWQVDVLAQLFKLAATRYSTAPALAMIAQGTTQFGRDGTREPDPKRERTVRFLITSGLTVDAYAYFPALDIARQRRDAKALLNHGRYHQDFAASPKAGDNADMHLRTAWDLYCEVTQIDEAEGPIRQDALRRAIDLLPQMPPAPGSAWLKAVFANAALAPAALEAIALKSVGLRNASMDTDRRAQTILTMKEAVDTLLARSAGDGGLPEETIRVPLRMLTTALVGEIEASFEQPRQPQQWGRVQNLTRDTEFLLRALPDQRWMGSLEPSLASRAYRAAIGLALKADEADLALDYLAHAAKRFPDQGVDLADRFLRQWEEKMRTASQPPEDEFYYYGREPLAAAPLTRGRQRRNIDRLERLIEVMDSIGLDPRRLPSVAMVFRACHGRTEAFTREGIERIFGSLARLAPETAASLSEQMRSGLSGDWRDRRAQQALGVKRTQSEVAAIIEAGYALAIELIDLALASDTSTWRYAVTKAGLTYDRVQFKQADEKKDFATYNQYRKEAFEAFAQTADRYAQLVAKGEQRDDATVYLAWFNAAVGSTELNYLTRDDLLVEGSPQDDQIDLIRKAIDALPGDSATRHIGAFARAISDSLGRLEPDVKPRIVRHSLRIIREHPAGAALNRLNDLYQDLVKDEIKLRLAVDGPDRIGQGESFGAVLALRYTAQVDRETGGFSRYLQNDVFMRFGMTWKSMNYRDLLRKNVEGALTERFEVEAIGFFDPLIPGRPVREGGEDGWMEKPLIYLTLKAKDKSVDRLPQVSMDLQFNDTVGPVTLPVISNAPPVVANESGGLRPVRKLDVTQVLDLRDIDDSDAEHRVTLEIIARGEGVIPDLTTLFPGLATSLDGYTVTEKNIEARPPALLESGKNMSGGYMGMVMPGAPPKDAPEYPEPDANGIWRMPSERSWMITFTPTGGPVGANFTLPVLASEYATGSDAKIAAKQYSDMDVVPITGLTVAVVRSPWSARNAVIASVAVLGLIGIGVLWSRRRRVSTDVTEEILPERMTPLSVITALRRILVERSDRLVDADRAKLLGEIHALEAAYFGPTNGHVPLTAELKPNGSAAAHEASGAHAADADGSLRTVLNRWVGVGR